MFAQNLREHVRSHSPGLPEGGCPRLGQRAWGAAVPGDEPARLLWGLGAGGSRHRTEKQRKDNPEAHVMGNPVVCVIEWRAQCTEGRGSPEHGRAGAEKPSTAMKQNHKSMFTCGERALSPPPRPSFRESPVGWARPGERRLLVASLGAPGCWWPNNLAPER